MEIQKLSLPPQDKGSEVSYLKQLSVRETFQLHTHDFYEFFYIIRGKAIHNINEENKLISKGSLVFIRPDDTHKYSFFNNYDMEIISVGVETWLIEDVCRYMNADFNKFSQLDLPPQIILEGYDFWDIKKKLECIVVKNPGVERKIYFLSILPQLIYLFEAKKQYNNDIIPNWLIRLIDEMNEPNNFTKGLDAMLGISNICHEHLTREFRKHLGITPTEFINTKRINYAAELLLQRKYEIIEICYMSGFNNLSYFYEVFKTLYNCTPKQFVKTNSY